jgi:hypothetical protein
MAAQRPRASPSRTMQSRTAVQRAGNIGNRPGRALEPATRARMQRHFGWDLSGVRVHTDESAAECAAGLGARAYTFGSHIAFAAAEYRPATSAGDELIAHELTHVLQQRAREAVVGVQPSSLSVSASTDLTEAEARASAADLAAGRSRSGQPLTPVGPTIQRAVTGRWSVRLLDDPVSFEARIRIMAARKLLERPDLTPAVRKELEARLLYAELVLDRYRDEGIGTGRVRLGVGGLATTTTDPATALVVGLLALAAAIAVSSVASSSDPKGGAAPALAEALRRLAEPVAKIESPADLAPRTGKVQEAPDQVKAALAALMSAVGNVVHDHIVNEARELAVALGLATTAAGVTREMLCDMLRKMADQTRRTDTEKWKKIIATQKGLNCRRHR